MHLGAHHLASLTELAGADLVEGSWREELRDWAKIGLWAKKQLPTPRYRSSRAGIVSESLWRFICPALPPVPTSLVPVLLGIANKATHGQVAK